MFFTLSLKADLIALGWFFYAGILIDFYFFKEK